MSTEIAGPSRPSAYATRPDNTLADRPDTRKPSKLRRRRVGPTEIVLASGPGEHPSRRFPQGVGPDSSILEGLPRDFQQQSLLRIHRKRLAWTDPEEACIEVAGVIQEAAFADVARTGSQRLGVIQPLQIPPPIVRELRDPIPTRDEQPPEVIRRAHTSGQTTAHTDDCHLLFARSRCGERPGWLYLRLACLLQHVVCDQPHRGIVEHERGRQGQTGRRAQAVAQLHGQQGVKSKLLEGTFRIYRLRRRVAKYSGHLTAHQP